MGATRYLNVCPGYSKRALCKALRRCPKLVLMKIDLLNHAVNRARFHRRLKPLSCLDAYATAAILYHFPARGGQGV